MGRGRSVGGGVGEGGVFVSSFMKIGPRKAEF
jgi:hypothetical protein